jgi:hypothetical protein
MRIELDNVPHRLDQNLLHSHHGNWRGSPTVLDLMADMPLKPVGSWAPDQGHGVWNVEAFLDTLG